MLILHFHQSPHLIYAIFSITADSDLKTSFVIEVTTQFPVPYDKKPSSSNSLTVFWFLSVYNVILVLLIPDVDWKFRNAI